MPLDEDGDPILPTSASELVEFLQLLAASFAKDPEVWQNITVPTFLEAWAAWMSASDRQSIAIGDPVFDTPSWSLIGDMLLAARIYE